MPRALRLLSNEPRGPGVGLNSQPDDKRNHDGVLLEEIYDVCTRREKSSLWRYSANLRSWRCRSASVAHSIEAPPGLPSTPATFKQKVWDKSVLHAARPGGDSKAPNPAIPGTEIERQGSTQSARSCPLTASGAGRAYAWRWEAEIATGAHHGGQAWPPHPLKQDHPLFADGTRRPRLPCFACRTA
jgi:hypothetical protein